MARGTKKLESGWPSGTSGVEVGDAVESSGLVIDSSDEGVGLGAATAGSDAVLAGGADTC